jgi:hypothetical protein
MLADFHVINRALILSSIVGNLTAMDAIVRAFPATLPAPRRMHIGCRCFIESPPLAPGGGSSLPASALSCGIDAVSVFLYTRKHKGPRQIYGGKVRGVCHTRGHAARLVNAVVRRGIQNVAKYRQLRGQVQASGCRLACARHSRKPAEAGAVVPP